MKQNKDIISALIGSAFFAVPYVSLSFSLVPSLVIGSLALGASELVLSGFKGKPTLKNTDISLYTKLANLKNQNNFITSMIPKLEDESIRAGLLSISETIKKIISTIEENPSKSKKLDNFFDYYMPVLIKIIKKYDDVENKKLNSDEGSVFMKSAAKLIKDTDKAFKTILSSLYSKDILDADADMKVYNIMLKADGIVDEHQIITKGSELDEK